MDAKAKASLNKTLKTNLKRPDFNQFVGCCQNSAKIKTWRKKHEKIKTFKTLDAFNRDPKRPKHEFSQYSQCRICLNSYGEKYRQDCLRLELDSGATDIKECGCGRLYKFIKKNGHRLDACRFCLKDGLYLKNL